MPMISLKEPLVDVRGKIQELISLERGCDLQVITSKKGAVRGNHRHRQGWHFCYLVSGALEYMEDSVAPDRWRVGAGEMFYSGPGVAHSMEFLEDSVMVVIGDRRRDQAEYEADLERIELLAGRPS